MKKQTWSTIVALVILLVAIPASATMIYFVGNSHTDDLMYNEFDQMTESTGKVVDWGRHMIPGAPLSWLWDHTDAICESPYGCYPNALPNYAWEHMTMQCHSRTLDEYSDGDVFTATKFINKAREGNPDVITYVYTNFKTKRDPSAWDDWLNDYNQPGAEETWLTADFYTQLVMRLRSDFAGQKPENIRLAPNGWIFHELYTRINAGTFSGMNSIMEMYEADMHLNELGGFIVATGLYAVFFHESPVGLPGTPYGVSESLARELQALVWDVVNDPEISHMTGLSGTAIREHQPRAATTRHNAPGGTPATLYSITGRKLQQTDAASVYISTRGANARIGFSSREMTIR